MPASITRMSSELSTGSELEAVRDKVDGALKSLADLLSAAGRPMPTETGNGTYLTDDPPDLLDRIQADIQSLSHLGIRDVATLLEAQKVYLSGTFMDDKHYLTEGLTSVSDLIIGCVAC